MKRLISLMAILAILSVGFSSCKKKPKKKVVKKVAVIKQDTVVEEPMVVEPQPEPEPPKHFLIAASFTRVENANEFMRKLQDLGYESKVFETYEGRFRVSYMGFADKDEALKVLAEERAKEGSANVWLYTPRKNY